MTTEIKSRNKIVVMCLVVLFAIGALSSLTGCGSANKKNAEVITTQLTQELDAYKSGDSVAVSAVLGADASAQFSEQGIDADKVYSAFFGNMTYTIDNVVVDGSEATVTLSITNIDFDVVKTVFETKLQAAMDDYTQIEDIDLNDDAQVNEFVMEALISACGDSSVGTKTTQATLNYTLDEQTNIWSSDSTDSLANAMFSGSQDLLG